MIYISISIHAPLISASPPGNSYAAEAPSNRRVEDDNMIMSDGLLRVFWPYDLPRSSSTGVIVGWRNSELDLFVLTVLEDVEVTIAPRLKLLTELTIIRSQRMWTMHFGLVFFSGTVRILSFAFSVSVVDLRCMFSVRQIQVHHQLRSIPPIFM